MSTQPKRIQRRMTANWRAPLDAEGRRPVYVGRPGRWGNLFKIGSGYRTRTDLYPVPEPISGPYEEGTYWGRTITGGPYPYDVRTVPDAAEAVELYKAHIDFYSDRYVTGIPGLVGRDLMCWCPPGPCHGDALLAWAARWEKSHA